VIGLYAFVIGAPRGLVGARGEALREVQQGELHMLIGDAPPELSVDALRAHDAAVRRIADGSEACLPARFGAGAETEAVLLARVEPRATELTEALQLVRGREQMTLRIHGAAQVTPRQSATSAGPGTRYLEERRRERRFPELEPLRAAVARLVRAERIERHSEPGLLASVYHLIDKGASAAYREAVARIEGLRVVVSGPWPAWSFAPEVAA
jgi:hypothetical protein